MADHREVLDFMVQKAVIISGGRLTEELDVDANFFSDLELDSLDFAEVLYSTADKFALLVEENSDWTSLRSIKLMADFLVSNSQK